MFSWRVADCGGEKKKSINDEEICLTVLLQLVRQKADPDDHAQRWRRGERGGGVRIQLARPRERAGDGDPHEQGEDPGERQHRGVHRHHARGVARQRAAGVREEGECGGRQGGECR